MNSSDFDNRFGGTKRLYGQTAVDHFRQAHVCVIGIGGVGSWAAEALARSAIGQLTLIDMDDLCITNVNRQIHALDGQIGRSKVVAMRERIQAINPDCQVEVIEDFIGEDNLKTCLDRGYDYVIDCIDSVKAKSALIAYCKRNKIPVITVGGAGGQVDPTQIQITDLSRTYQDPLAAKVRSNLRRFYNFSKNPKRRFYVDCVFSTEQLVYPQPDGSVCGQKPDNEGAMRLDCASGFGAATAVTATFGFVAVARVLKKLAERAERLSAQAG